MFNLNYGSSLIGTGDQSTPIDKPGHRIGVDREALDTLISRFHLRRPDFIKLDVEGAEVDAVAGMMGTLRASRPGLMIELHGRDAAVATLHTLAELDYRYTVPATGAHYATARALADAIGDDVRPGSRERPTLKRFISSFARIVRSIRATIANWGPRGLWYRATGNVEGLYSIWVRNHTPDEVTLEAERANARAADRLLGLITFVARGDDWPGARTVASVTGQTYSKWEWIVVATDTACAGTATALDACKDDVRIRIIRQPAHYDPRRCVERRGSGGDRPNSSRSRVP